MEFAGRIAYEHSLLRVIYILKQWLKTQLRYQQELLQAFSIV
jgi:hypothetical protein